MDPEACLKELLELNAEVGDFMDEPDEDVDGNFQLPEEMAGKVNDLVDHVAALNGWLEKGGFLPKDWATKREGESKDERRDTLNANTLSMIQEVLWPGGDADHEWSSDELDDISRLLHNANLGPKEVDEDEEK